MAEPARRSALAGHLRPGHHGPPGEAGVWLRELRVDAMAQVHGAADAHALAGALATLDLHGAPGAQRAAGDEDLRLLWNGPGQYLAASRRHREQQLSAALNEALSGSGAAAVDVSHARTVLRLGGPACREALAKGCPLDLDVMEPGACAPTVIGHFNVLVHCTGEQAFELYVTRSFALAFHEWLLHACAEFGVDVLE